MNNNVYKQETEVNTIYSVSSKTRFLYACISGIPKNAHRPRYVANVQSKGNSLDGRETIKYLSVLW